VAQGYTSLKHRIAPTLLILALPIVPLFSDLSKFEQRFEPAPEISETLDPSTVPDSFKLPEQPLELVSLNATEAASPEPPNGRRTIESVDATELAERLYADRLLLSEIRKEVPESRREAESYLFRLKDLAGRSDPVRLVPLASRVLDQAPIYFDWLARDFENQNEQVTEYYVGGARGFSFALEKFKTAVMFTIMNRLDVASRLILEMTVE